MSESNILFVLKRNNVLQIFNKEKIKQRLEKLLIVEFILDNIDLDIIINKVVLSIYDKISTKLFVGFVFLSEKVTNPQIKRHVVKIIIKLIVETNPTKLAT